MLNYLARLGWSHGDDEMFSREQFVEWFDLDHLGKSPAQWDPDKLDWLNAHYMKASRQRAPRDARQAASDGTRHRCAATEQGAPLALVIALLKDRCIDREANSPDWPRCSTSEPVTERGRLARSTSPTRSARRSPICARQARRQSNGARQRSRRAIKETLAAHRLKMPQLAMPVRVLVAGTTQTPSIDAVLDAVRPRDRAGAPRKPGVSNRVAADAGSRDA